MSSSSIFLCKTHFLLTLIAILIVSSTRVSRVEAIKAPIHPEDILPLLPHQVSWPILNSLRSAADLLPSFVGAASIANNSDFHWKGSCFYENTAWLELHNKSGTQFGGGTLHIKVSNAHSWTCMDIYVFATPYRVTWDYYFLSREHTLEFDEWSGKAEYDYVKHKGVSIFLMEAGMLGTLKALWEVFPLFTNTGWGESSNLAFLKKHMGATFEARPEPWVTNITVDDIHSGDFLAISKIRGRWGGFETLEKWVSGAYAGHSAVCLRDAEGKLWVGESGHEDELHGTHSLFGQLCTTFWQWPNDIESGLFSKLMQKAKFFFPKLPLPIKTTLPSQKPFPGLFVYLLIVPLRGNL